MLQNWKLLTCKLQKCRAFCNLWQTLTGTCFLNSSNCRFSRSCESDVRFSDSSEWTSDSAKRETRGDGPVTDDLVTLRVVVCCIISEFSFEPFSSWIIVDWRGIFTFGRLKSRLPGCWASGRSIRDCVFFLIFLISCIWFRRSSVFCPSASE